MDVHRQAALGSQTAPKLCAALLCLSLQAWQAGAGVQQEVSLQWACLSAAPQSVSWLARGRAQPEAGAGSIRWLVWQGALAERSALSVLLG